jgi:hypothetical protein
MPALTFDADEPDELLLTEEVSAMTRVPVGTLRRWRCQKPPVGPPSFSLNGFRVVYRKSKVRQWLMQQEELAGDTAS